MPWRPSSSASCLPNGRGGGCRSGRLENESASRRSVCSRTESSRRRPRRAWAFESAPEADGPFDDWLALAVVRQQRGAPQCPLLPPGELRARTAERLLPAELQHAAEQLEHDRLLPPPIGRHSMSLERAAIGLQDGVLRLGKHGGVECEV